MTTIYAAVDSKRARAGQPVRGVHGKPSTYQNWGCRCDDCRTGARVADRHRPGRTGQPFTPTEHGEIPDVAQRLPLRPVQGEEAAGDAGPPRGQEGEARPRSDPARSGDDVQGLVVPVRRVPGISVGGLSAEEGEHPMSDHDAGALAWSDTVLAEFPCTFDAPPLRSNDRGRWQVSHSKRKAVRHEAYVVATQLARAVPPGTFPLPGPVDVRLVWSVNTRTRRDADGPQPTLKAYLDGLVDAGILSDDRHTVVRRAWCEIEYDPTTPPSVRVEILQVTP